jgi:hypothetical protein
LKSNDNIPADEMLLAEAIAAAKARGMGWCAGTPFMRDGSGAYPHNANACCALGALHFAGHVPIECHAIVVPQSLGGVSWGNDLNWNWRQGADHGESLGWAFRCAMEES